jgi:hypothetical protein
MKCFHCKACGSNQISAVKFDGHMGFDTLLADWIPLTCALNSINRGMGLSGLCPFVIPPAVVEKLRFIHQVVKSCPVGFECAASSISLDMAGAKA